MYPTLQTQSKEVLKRISHDLVKGIKINRQGRFNVDISKIHKNCLELKCNNIGIGGSSNEIPSQAQALGKPSDFLLTRRLVKKEIRHFVYNKFTVKYLIIVDRIEKPVHYIEAQNLDKTHHDIEVRFEVNCVPMQKNL